MNPQQAIQIASEFLRNEGCSVKECLGARLLAAEFSGGDETWVVRYDRVFPEALKRNGLEGMIASVVIVTVDAKSGRAQFETSL